MLKRITSYVLIAVMLLCLMPATVSADADWKTLYAATIAEIEAGYKNGTKGRGEYNKYGDGMDRLYFSVQDINFDGVPELYHAVISMFELEPDVQSIEEIYYIKGGKVVKGKIESGADFCLLPMYAGRKAAPGDVYADRWQFAMRNKQTGEVCFITNDSYSGFVEFPEITYSKLTFDSTTGVLSAKVLLHRNVESYTQRVYLQGYDYVGADCYTNLSEDAGWGIYDWKPCYIHQNATPKVGDVIGEALHTDIVAYINHYAIPSYAVNGTSCIVAEDLRNYCFDVNWDGATKSLYISRNAYTTPNGMTFKKTGKPGTKFTDLLKTDISVYANGKKLTSYAMNGYTMIPIEELTMFGECHWVSGERAIKLWVDGVKCLAKRQSVTSYAVMDGATIQAILDGKLTFTDFDTNKTANINNWTQINSDYSAVPNQYTVIDLDCDGSNELAIEFSSRGDIAIITVMDGTLMAYCEGFRGFTWLKTDGSANFSNSAFDGGVHKIRAFTYGGIVWDELIYSDSGDVSGQPTYRVNGKNTTKAAADKAYRTQYAKPDALWAEIH